MAQGPETRARGGGRRQVLVARKESTIEQFPEKYDVEAPLLDPHDVSRRFE